MLDLIKSDYIRYKCTVGSILSEPSFFLVLLYRVRHHISKQKFVIRFLFSLILEPMYMFLTLLFGIQIPKSCVIGSGFLIHHFGGIIINPTTRIGDNCTIRHNVTIGSRYSGNDSPTLGHNVNIGTGVIIIGQILIGNNVLIGAGSVVLKDIPSNSTAVGNPLKIIINKPIS